MYLFAMRCVQLGWARWWHRLQPVRVQRQHNASDTRAKRGHNAKNNVRITRNNAGVCGSIVESGATYGLYFRELRDQERDLEKKCLPSRVSKVRRRRVCPTRTSPALPKRKMVAQAPAWEAQLQPAPIRPYGRTTPRKGGTTRWSTRGIKIVP
jgi:hypothetical protein